VPTRVPATSRTFSHLSRRNVPKLSNKHVRAVKRILKARGCASAVGAVTRYASSLQWVHWATAGGILGCFGLIYAAKYTSSPTVKATLMAWHSQLGLVVLGSAAYRVGLRATTAIPPHLPGPVWEHLASKAVHGAMYPLMLVIPATGVLMAYYGGGGIPMPFGLRLPGKDSPKEDDLQLAKDSVEWHKQLGSVLEILVPLHIGATGYHLAMGKNPLPRMVPDSAMGLAEQIKLAWRARPGGMMGGAALASLSGLWLVSTAAGYAFEDGGGSAAPTVEAQPGRVITMEELEKHNKEDDLWIAVDGKVYDMTKYHKVHPGFGGPAIIVKNAGADATKGFRDAKHSPKAMDVQKGLLIGELERNIDTELAKVMNLDDMKTRALEVLTPGAEAYYNAGAEDGTSMAEALAVWDRDWRLRPRNFIDVSNVDLSTTVLGHKLDVPIMAAPTALLKMGHEDGEAAVARGCFATGTGNCLSTTASLSIEDVADAAPDCYRWFQLYVYKDHEKTKNLVQRAEKAGYSAICFTVDLPVLGNRTSLKRIGFKVPEQFKMANMAKEKETEADKKIAQEKVDAVDVNKPGDRAAYVNKLYDQSLTLELLTWLGECTTLPIVVKGVLRGDTAEVAARHPMVRGIVVSNHGGRQLDNCIAPLTALPEIVAVVEKVNEDRKLQGLEPVEVYVDGGIKRGRDIFKALALGAKAVLVGRPMIYGMAVGGDKGVQRTVEILRDELKTIMQLSGTQDVGQIDRSFVLRSGTDTSVNPIYVVPPTGTASPSSEDESA